MKSTAVKAAYEEWARTTQPKDAGATQRIETRRAFYSGVWACMTSGIVDALDGAAGPDGVAAEIKEFFDAEVKTGYGLPKGDL